MRTEKLDKKKLFHLFLALGAILVATGLSAGDNETRANPWAGYDDVLPETLARALPVDPARGYRTTEVKPGVYVVTDGIWQSAFVTTGKGVIVFDAPESYGAKLPEAIAAVTDEPIRMLVYSHAHKDHIGGSRAFADVPGLKIVALASVGKFLDEKRDPNRLVPNVIFEGRKTIRMGSRRVELTDAGGYHSDEGDLFVYLPDDRFLMAVDTLAPGYVPFMDFDLTSNFHRYLKVFDRILAYDFDVFVGGHLTHPGGRGDVELTKEYALDVYRTTRRVHSETDLMGVMARTAEAAGGWDNKYLLFRAFLEEVIGTSAREIEGRWAGRLANVDVFVDSHVRTALIYVRWDD